MPARHVVLIALSVLLSGCQTNAAAMDKDGSNMTMDDGGQVRDLAAPPGSDLAGADLAQGGGDMGRPVGAPCTADAQCKTLQCLTEADDATFKDGYCTVKTCDEVTNKCPAMSECSGLSGAMRICLGHCDMGTCRTGYRCCGPGATAIWCAPPESLVCKQK